MTENEKAVDKSQFRFLTDEPVSEDSFGSHGRVAGSIRAMIESNGPADKPGMTIGLEGTWGSGKSSVIKMLEDGWKDNPDIKVFTFDAWAHEGDSLRRSFLEKLICSLQREDGDNASWIKNKVKCERFPDGCDECKDKSYCRPDRIKDELRSRREDSTIKSEPQITSWGLVFAVATLAMPIGVSLLSSAKNLTHYYFWLGTILAAAPLLFLAVAICYYWKEKNKNILSEIVGKTKDVTTHSTFRGVEPSSIEFIEYFKEILELCSEGEKSRNLVIVFDNLDRVHSEVAFKAWSTMRTFMDLTCGDTPTLRTWLIVPYDPDAITELWKVKENNDRSLGLAFKEKTFQIRYKVAQPLTSRWEEYFKSCVIQAFEDSIESDRVAIFHIFRIQALPAYKYRPTPRAMKIFINRVLAVSQQADAIRLPEIALYVALELNEETILEDLATETPDRIDTLKQFVGNDWQEQLAAIHYGVPREDAAEVLFEPKFHAILEEGDSDKMQKIMKLPGAHPCCARVVLSEMKEYQLKQLLMASRAFSKLDCSSGHVKMAIRYLAKHIEIMEDAQWGIGNGLDDSSADDLIRLLCIEDGIGSIVAGKLFLTDSSVDSEKRSQLLPAWIKGVSRVVQYLEGVIEPFEGVRVLLCDIDEYLKCLEAMACDSEHQKLIKYIMPADNTKDMYREFALTTIAAGEFREEDSHILLGIIEMPCWTLSNRVEAVADTLRNVLPNLNADSFYRMFKFALMMMSRGPDYEKIRDMLHQYASSREICVTLEQIGQGLLVKSLCCTLFLLFRPEISIASGKPGYAGSQIYNSLLETSDDECKTEVADLIAEYDLFGRILESIKDKGICEKPFIKSLVKLLIVNDKTPEVPSVEDFLEYHATIRDIIYKENDEVKKSTYDCLVRRLMERRLKEQGGDNLLDALSSDEIAPRHMELYRIAIEDSDLDTSNIKDKVKSYLREVKEDCWESEFSNDKGLSLKVALLLNQNGDSISLGYLFSTALINHAVSVQKAGKKIRGDLADQWADVFDCLSEDERLHFRRSLVNKVIGTGDVSITALMPVYGKELIDAIVLSYEESSRGIQHKIVALANGDTQQRKWVLFLLAKKMDVSDFQPSNIAGLKDRLSEMIVDAVAFTRSGTKDADTPDEFSITEAEACKLANALGVIVDKPDFENNDDAEAQGEE